MNRRQRERQAKRRAQHVAKTRPLDRPAVILDQESFPRVENAHIVPRMYQRAWAVSGMVAVHRPGGDACTRLSTKKAGARPAYYRRKQMTGEEIDDVEASLAYVENKAAPPLRALIEGPGITEDDKGGVAQFVGVQMLRGPAFFDRREEVIRPVLEELREGDVKPEALAAAGGDLEKVRARVIEAYLDPTQRFMTMLQTAPKMAAILALMRWELIEFEEPLLAYSDHPVVIWPLNVQQLGAPVERQDLGPLGALEIRVPLSPSVGLLMTWVDLSDRRTSVRPEAAGEFNAPTVAQADEEWMHRIGGEPPIASAPLYPLSRLTEPRYGAQRAYECRRRAMAQRFIERNRHREWVNEIPVLTELPTV